MYQIWCCPIKSHSSQKTSFEILKVKKKNCPKYLHGEERHLIVSYLLVSKHLMYNLER